MKVLFLLPYMFIPPDNGNKNLTFNLLKYVTKHVECDLILMVGRNINTENVCKNIRYLFPSVGNIWLYKKPFGLSRLFAELRVLGCGYHPAIGKYWNKELVKWLQNNVRKRGYDLVHFDMIHMAQYKSYCDGIPAVLIASDAYSLAMITARNAASIIVHKIKLTVEQVLLANYERRKYRHFDIVCAVSRVDSSSLSRHVKGINVRTIGVAIGEEFVAVKPREFESKDKETECGILCVGSIAVPWVAEGVLKFLCQSYPRIQAIMSNVQITVLGRNPTPALSRCLKSDRRIKHIDFAEDYIGFLNNDWVYVYAQQCGSGFQTKVQQAMALGLPVVGFEFAFSGMDVESGKHCFICRTQEELTENVIRLLQDRNLRTRIGLAAASRIRNRYSVERVGEEVMLCYRSLIRLQVEGSTRENGNCD